MVQMYMVYICIWCVYVCGGVYVYGEMVCMNMYRYMYMVALSAGWGADFRSGSGPLNMIYDGCDKVLVYVRHVVYAYTKYCTWI